MFDALRKCSTLFMLFTLYAADIFAIQCIQGDYDEMLCRLPVLPGTRCKDAKWFRIYCNHSTDGCRGVSGGCIGMTPPGHWYPIVEGGYPRWRCRCGCFGEETRFDRDNGLISGRTLIETSLTDPSRIHFLDSWDSLEGQSFTTRRINSIMFSRESRAVELRTLRSRTIFLSPSHPVVIAEDGGLVKMIKKARSVVAGDLLLDRDGRTDPVVSSQLKQYGKNMLNFNVHSNRGAHHFVSANGLLMGDVGWQETLNSYGSRILYRTEILKFLSRRQKDRVKA